MGQPLDNSRLNSREGTTDFLIKIMFRKNVNWQGEVHWLNNDKKRYFRSSLELLMLIQEAMEKGEIPRAEYEIRTWEQDQSANAKGPEEENYIALFKENE